MNRPQPNDYDTYCENYIKHVKDDVLADLEHQVTEFPDFLKQLPDEKVNYAYAEGKWTIKQMLGHILDTERILTYRLVSISRNEQQQLPGFDEDSYEANAESGARNFDELIQEFVYLRKANLFLYKSLSEIQLNRRGVANGAGVTARALLFIIAGHLLHHVAIIKERYL
ncbi:DinB family protein [Pedobacter sp. HMF7647]|uniref:DinB family protein n=1 Tax=Hufsiella arboris TaxID=2695275 RepID=A0A7K1Y5I7_9SPHI|nr:DinB family protein [Hufsiella arboris]MXV49631.1 DinB family protein [Hufsiella arboris]